MENTLLCSFQRPWVSLCTNFSSPSSNYDTGTIWCCNSSMDNFKRAEL